MIALCIATLATNIAANVVSPANDFAHLAPKKISFRTGGYITGVIGVLMMPWKLVADPSGYIFTWLIGYSALLGPIAGIMIADYFVLRGRKLDADELYRAHGIYRYTNGFSLAAIGAFILAVLPNLPGFLVHIKAIDGASVPDALEALYQQAWFVGFALAFLLYLVFRKLSPVKIAA
jgi:NCS1 family nucleobase:cation symporter-1